MKRKNARYQFKLAYTPPGPKKYTQKLTPRRRAAIKAVSKLLKEVRSALDAADPTIPRNSFRYLADWAASHYKLDSRARRRARTAYLQPEYAFSLADIVFAINRSYASVDLLTETIISPNKSSAWKPHDLRWLVEFIIAFRKRYDARFKNWKYLDPNLDRHMEVIMNLPISLKTPKDYEVVETEEVKNLFNADLDSLLKPRRKKRVRRPKAVRPMKISNKEAVLKDVDRAVNALPKKLKDKLIAFVVNGKVDGYSVSDYYKRRWRLE